MFAQVSLDLPGLIKQTTEVIKNTSFENVFHLVDNANHLLGLIFDFRFLLHIQ